MLHNLFVFSERTKELHHSIQVVQEYSSKSQCLMDEDSNFGI